MTQTVNAYPGMPGTVDGLCGLKDRLDAIRAANVEHHIALIDIAARAGVRAICLGELFAAPYFALGRDAMWFGLAEDAADGPTVRSLAAAAAKHSMVIVAPIYELDSATGKRFNTAVVIDADGSVIGKYRKSHIPVGGNEQGSFDEGFYYGPSELPQNPASIKILGENPSFPVFDTTAGRIGVSICYDRHFEGVVRSLSAGGAQLVFCPAVTFGSKSERMWEIEFEVDASRHGVFIGGSNRLGSEQPWGQAYFGRTHFTGPSGRVGTLGDDPRVVIADLDIGSLDIGDGSGWDIQRDSRPSIYS